MKAIVTSIGEPTTELCVWSLQRNGFEVELYQDNTTLCEKLERAYNESNEDFIRVDADVIVNTRMVVTAINKSVWWVQYQTYDWYKQDVTNGGIQYIRKEALPLLREKVQEFKYSIRPETELFRLNEFHNPRRCITIEGIKGLHGFGQNNLQDVRELKRQRHQEGNYDFELVERINSLCQR